MCDGGYGMKERANERSIAKWNMYIHMYVCIWKIYLYSRYQGYKGKNIYTFFLGNLERQDSTQVYIFRINCYTANIPA